jgi:AcrR family transcriptional regulator
VSPRPRSPEAHAAILQAALELAVSGGLQAMSMEGIAARAGVGKATVYRRWKTKEALFAEALRSVAAPFEAPDTGDTRGDFIAALQIGSARTGEEGFRVIPRLLVDAAGDPELLAVVHEVVLQPRWEVVRTIVRRGIERGELREDVDVELCVRLLLGPLIMTVLAAGGDRTGLTGLAGEVWDALTQGLGAPGRRPTRPPRASRSARGA